MCSPVQTVHVRECMRGCEIEKTVKLGLKSLKLQALYTMSSLNEIIDGRRERESVCVKRLL